MITTLVFAEREFPSVYVCGSSMQGDRSYQQDALLYKRKGNGVLAAVCDGMGGMESGELASAEALRVLEQKFSAPDRNEKIPVFYGCCHRNGQSCFRSEESERKRHPLRCYLYCRVYRKKQTLLDFHRGQQALSVQRRGPKGHDHFP